MTKKYRLEYEGKALEIAGGESLEAGTLAIKREQITSLEELETETMPSSLTAWLIRTNGNGIGDIVQGGVPVGSLHRGDLLHRDDCPL